jgi:hypothetical protein
MLGLGLLAIIALAMSIVVAWPIHFAIRRRVATAQTLAAVSLRLRAFGGLPPLTFKPFWIYGDGHTAFEDPTLSRLVIAARILTAVRILAIAAFILALRAA